MDMKRILQAMDGVATKPVAGANDMAKFLSIVDKNAKVQILHEGNPHKVTLPVQMAMQHYQKEEPIQATQHARVGRESVVRKYFDEAEQAIQEEQIKKRNFYKQYAQTIAERVLMKENAGTDILSKAVTGVKSRPITSAGIAGGVAANVANNKDGTPIPDELSFIQQDIYPGFGYSWRDLLTDVGITGIQLVGGMILGPPGEVAALVANASRIARFARLLSKIPKSIADSFFIRANKGRLAEALHQFLNNVAWSYIMHNILGFALKYIPDDSKDQVNERSTTEKQARTMAAAAHNPAFAKKVGIDQKVAKEFNQKDKGTALLSNAMKGKRKKVKELDGHSMGFKPQGPGAQSNAPDGGHLNLSELSTDTLGKYKKAAYADAKKADAEGNYARGDKRFKGINKATIKQFDNDLKKHDQNPIKEANAKKRTLKNSNPCWDGYKPVGTKKKGGRTVPNCVPKE